MSYVMKERNIPLKSDWDVIVLGGGPSGCTAAAAAAREGAKTLLIESSGCLGGMGTAGLVPTFCPFSDKEKIIYKGLAQKVLNEVKSQSIHIKSEQNDWVPIDPEKLKIIYDDMVTDAGANILFNTSLCAVDVDKKGEVSTIIVSNKSGLTAYQAKVYIDCTGDADLVAWAGGKYIKGDSETGELQPATHCFILGNVDDYSYTFDEKIKPLKREAIINKILDSDKYVLLKDKHLCNALIAPGTVGFNAGHIWEIDNTNPESVSKALIKGRKMAEEIKCGLTEYYPEAFANSFVAQTAPAIGIRETRRIVGDYVLTLEDYINRKSFDDEICRNSYFIDVHPSLKDLVEKSEDSYRIDYKTGESHGIPYRCLTPKELKNVLVAGRSISCDRIVQGSVRVMPVCLAMGEAAGIAGAQALNISDYDVHKVDVKRLRDRLKEEGAYLP